MSDGYTLSVEK